MTRALPLTLLFCGCATSQHGRTTFEAGSINAAGYVHHPPEAHRDTPAAIGDFDCSATGLQIHYAAFTYGISFADPAFLRKRGDRIIWTRRTKQGEWEKITTLYEDRFGNSTICVSFPSAGPTNFIVNNPTADQISEAERVISTFVPKKTNDG